MLQTVQEKQSLCECMCMHRCVILSCLLNFPKNRSTFQNSFAQFLNMQAVYVFACVLPVYVTLALYWFLSVLCVCVCVCVCVCERVNE